METFGVIAGSIVVIACVFLFIVIIPMIIGKLLFRWSGRRVHYVFYESISSITAAVVGSLVLTGLILLVGMVFNQQWAFSGGLLIVYTFWIAIKEVWGNIRDSKGM